MTQERLTDEERKTLAERLGAVESAKLDLAEAQVDAERYKLALARKYEIRGEDQILANGVIRRGTEE